MSPKQSQHKLKFPDDLWTPFYDAQKKAQSKLYQKIEALRCVEQEPNGKTVFLSLCVETQAQFKQIDVRHLEDKFSTFHNLTATKIHLTINPTPKTTPNTTAPQTSPSPSITRSGSHHLTPLPLQALNHTLLDLNADSPSLAAMQQAIAADEKNAAIYTQLTKRTQLLAGKFCCTIEFPWRLQVGGQRGFDERLLPAFHPVYGVPYVTSSSIRGAVRAWVKRTQGNDQADRLFGTLENGVGVVQFLDAYPTKPCLSLDTATPLWKWVDANVQYSPEPHSMLSLWRPILTIGIQPTARGTESDIRQLLNWIPQALSEGLGSRVSAGYGQATIEQRSSDSAEQCTFEKYAFSLRTAGIYGAVPDRKTKQAEFRPTAVRGVLRYWFRAVALAMYSPASVRKLEAEMFGAIEPKTTVGALTITTDLSVERISKSPEKPHYFEGDIYLSALDAATRHLAGLLLQLGSHLGGLGNGSRRPLHWNKPDPGLRGSHWELEDFIWECDRAVWSEKILKLRDAMRAWVTLCIKRWSNLGLETRIDAMPGNGSPGNGRRRYQDVLNARSRLLLLPDRDLELLEEVQDWKMNGMKDTVRGKALSLMYGDLKFKGVNPHSKQGNVEVGGSASTPSFATISSNFPFGDDITAVSYQAVVIFGAQDHTQRMAFANALIAEGAIEIPLEFAVNS